MTTQHTPGPWRTADMHKHGLYMNDGAASVVQADEAAEEDEPIQHIAFVSCHADYKRGTGHKAQCEARDANARLIAAAPDLLEALKAVMEALIADLPQAEGGPTVQGALAAIAKAEGQP
jgi:hypothetical protein